MADANNGKNLTLISDPDFSIPTAQFGGLYTCKKMNVLKVICNRFLDAKVN